jgi:hypothetical protein
LIPFFRVLLSKSQITTLAKRLKLLNFRIEGHKIQLKNNNSVISQQFINPETKADNHDFTKSFHQYFGESPGDYCKYRMLKNL